MSALAVDEGAAGSSFAPKATELPRGNEMTLRAKSSRHRIA
jgi:hypothetical protein